MVKKNRRVSFAFLRIGLLKNLPDANRIYLNAQTVFISYYSSVGDDLDCLPLCIIIDIYETI